MPEDSNGGVGTANILFLAGAVVIGIWFLITAGEAADYGVSPIYVAFYFAPICLIGMLFLLVFALSSSKKGVKTIVVESKEELEELLAQEEEKKAQASLATKLLLAYIGFAVAVVVVFTQW